VNATKYEKSKQFWVPGKSAGKYIFGRDVLEEKNFLKNHKQDDNEIGLYSDEYRSYRPKDDNEIIIHTSNYLIYGLTMWGKFIILNNNIIRKNIEYLKLELFKRFKCNFEIIKLENISIENGEDLFQYEIPELCFEFSANSNNEIVFISICEI
jgi:hypothetical protein